MIRRKRKATEKFLKRDIADLLADRLDDNAYGRVIDFFIFFWLINYFYFSFMKFKDSVTRDEILRWTRSLSSMLSF